METLRQRRARKEARKEERKATVKRVSSLYAQARTREQMADGVPPFPVTLELQIGGIPVEPFIPEIVSGVCSATGLELASAAETVKGHTGPIERGGITLFFKPTQTMPQAH